jgi:hypothetical protein
MAKKAAYHAEAERLYVVNHLTLEDIASRLSNNVSVRTLQTWKTAGDWENKRKQLVQQQSLFSEDLYTLCRKLLKSIEKDIDEDKEPSRDRMNTFVRLTNSLSQTKKYEDTLDKHIAEDDESQREMTPEELISIFRKGLAE